MYGYLLNNDKQIKRDEVVKFARMEKNYNRGILSKYGSFEATTFNDSSTLPAKTQIPAASLYVIDSKM